MSSSDITGRLSTADPSGGLHAVSFVTGATGWIGLPPSSPNCSTPDIQVLGLRRVPTPRPRRSPLGAQVQRGDLNDLYSLRAGAAASDGGGPPRIQPRLLPDGRRRRKRTSRRSTTIGAPWRAPTGHSSSPRAYSGLTSGRSQPSRTCPIQASTRGCRRSGGPVVRHARGTLVVRAVRSHRPRFLGSRLRLPWSASPARKVSPATSTRAATGGPQCIRLDAANLVRLAVKDANRPARHCTLRRGRRAPAPSPNAIGRGLDLPVVSIPADQANDHFGWMARLLRRRRPASSSATRQLLGGTPCNPDSSPTSTPATTSSSNRRTGTSPGGTFGSRSDRPKPPNIGQARRGQRLNAALINASG